MNIDDAFPEIPLMRQRLEEIGVPGLDDIPADMMLMVWNGLESGRILCIVKAKEPDGVFRATWSFLRPKSHRQ